MVVVGAVILSSCGGCSWGKGGGGWKFASLNPKRIFSREPVKEDPQTPTRLVASWTNATLTTPGEAAKRGFGGRLVFFGEKDKPVRVDGQLVVYAFDETDRPAYETQPSRRYVFPCEELVRHESANEAGASYSVWLPWDEVGGPTKKIGLIVRFEPKKGAIVLSEQTRHYLPGATLPQDAATPQLAATLPPLTRGTQATRAATELCAQLPLEAPAGNGVQLAQFAASAATAAQTPMAGAVPSVPSPLETTTISLPRGLAGNIGRGPQQGAGAARLPASAAAATYGTPAANVPAATPTSPTKPATTSFGNRQAPIMAQPMRAQPLKSSVPASLPAPAAPVAP